MCAPAIKDFDNAGLLGEQHGAATLDRRRDAALLFGGEVGVFARQNLARVGNVADHQLGLGERESLGGEGLVGVGFGGAHF